MWNEQPLGMKERAEIDVIRRITPRGPPTNFAQFGDALEHGRDFEAERLALCIFSAFGSAILPDANEKQNADGIA
jgi:hypothetical protein